MANTKSKTKAGARPASRRGRAEELRRRRERRSLRNRVLAAGLLLVLVGVVVFLNVRDSGSTPEPPPSTSCKEDTEYDGSSRDHVPNPTYEVNPPAGGAHMPIAAQPGFYREGSPVPPDGQLVHAMEHGFVVLWYKPGLASDEMQKVEALSDRFGRELVVAPRLSLGGPVAVTAWHHRMLCTAIDAEAIASFVERYADKGPEKGFL